jgi:hypothetical protein
MTRVSWFSYRHPFAASVGFAAAAFGAAVLYGASSLWAALTAAVTAAVILVLWWPRRGVLAQDVKAWVDDPDPRVAKPTSGTEA